MPSSVKHLVIGSTEAYSGKAATILGLGLQLQEKGLSLSYGKPVGSNPGTGSDISITEQETDLEFIASVLNLPPRLVRSPLVSLSDPSITSRLEQLSRDSDPPSLDNYCKMQGEDLVLLEGPADLDEGSLFNLSIRHIAAALNAPILLVARYHSALVVDTLLAAKQRLGDYLMGVVIDDIPGEELSQAESHIRPFLEAQGISVLGMIPRSPLMRSISVRQIVDQLDAEVLCRQDRLSLMVETLTIGAMNVNSALRYFRRGINMAVVTGGDRADIQLAALETSTHCLVLTGHLEPSEEIVNRATDLEVPILAVDSDTLTTVERIDRMFGQVGLHETAKVTCAKELMEQHFNLDRLLEILQTQRPMAIS